MLVEQNSTQDSNKSSKTPSTMPPMLRQYLDYKKEKPDCLFFIQVGDFYEAFFEDARTIARTLNLTLTSRDKNNPDPIPMCGVPIAVIDGYLERLVVAGFSVAIISQISNAQAKNGIERVLERIVTPGVRVLGNQAENRSSNYLLAIWLVNETTGYLAWSDIQSGSIILKEELPIQELVNSVRTLSPVEIVIAVEDQRLKIDRRQSWIREIERFTKSEIKYRILSSSQLERFSDNFVIKPLRGAAKKVAALLCSYIDETTVNVSAVINKIEYYDDTKSLIIDAVTKNNLELFKAGRDFSNTGSLFWVLDKTITTHGSRLLGNWINAPLKVKREIDDRLNAVEALSLNNTECVLIRELLSKIPDLERIATRLSLKVITPKELGALRDALEVLPKIKQQLSLIFESNPEALLIKSIKDELVVNQEFEKFLADFLIENPPHFINEGGIVKSGFDAEVDRLRGLKNSSDSWISELELKQREITGINSLKIKQNNVIGFFIEVTSTNASRVPEHYIKKQSTANSERFTTIELKKQEEEIISSSAKIIAREKSLFEDAKENLKKYFLGVRELSLQVAMLDILCGFSILAQDDGFIKPKICDEIRLKIQEGKHPALIRMNKQNITANSFDSRSTRSFLLTGPNMGGKSTYLRQNALIVIMAQIGSFVPAKHAEIGIVDKIFARIGASDDLVEGDSTFMVEMRETANIINAATERSLVLIDELGRGTSTDDGYSIARAVFEFLVIETKCTVLFATHFHDLTLLSEELENIKNLSVTSIESNDGIIFTHEIKEEPADRSYGIEVAELAGVSKNVLLRAKEILDFRITEKTTNNLNLEEDKYKQKYKQSQLPLFLKEDRSSLATSLKEEKIAKLKKEILEIDINTYTPINALNKLLEIQENVKKL